MAIPICCMIVIFSNRSAKLAPPPPPPLPAVLEGLPTTIGAVEAVEEPPADCAEMLELSDDPRTLL